MVPLVPVVDGEASQSQTYSHRRLRLVAVWMDAAKLESGGVGRESPRDLVPNRLSAKGARESIAIIDRSRISTVCTQGRQCQPGIKYKVYFVSPKLVDVRHVGFGTTKQIHVAMHVITCGHRDSRAMATRWAFAHPSISTSM